MADRIPLSLVNVLVQTGIVLARDKSIRLGLGVQKDSVGWVPKESIAWKSNWQSETCNWASYQRSNSARRFKDMV